MITKEARAGIRAVYNHPAYAYVADMQHRSLVIELLDALDDSEAELTAVLALADQWAAVDGVDQRAATLHAVADDLRAALGKPDKP